MVEFANMSLDSALNMPCSFSPIFESSDEFKRIHKAKKNKAEAQNNALIAMNEIIKAINSMNNRR